MIAEVELNDELNLGLRMSATGLAIENGDNALALGVNTTNPATKEFDVFGLFDSGTLSAEFSADTVLQALAQVTNVRVMQNPVVFTADNQEAFFFDGSEFPFANQVIANAGTAGGTQSFEYRSVGLVLNARPRITAQKDVDMDIRLELSKIGPAINDGGPTVDRRQTTTNIVVKNGQTIILSGLLKEEETTLTRKVPLWVTSPSLENSSPAETTPSIAKKSSPSSPHAWWTTPTKTTKTSNKTIEIAWKKCVPHSPNSVKPLRPETTRAVVLESPPGFVPSEHGRDTDAPGPPVLSSADRRNSLWGCASTSSTVVQASESPEFNLEATPTASQAFRIAVEPRGQTGWTGDLPVVSPEGDRMAMADPERPGDILIRSIPNNRLDDPMVLGRVPGPIRFGRSVDDVGFAVMDGERVGRASWVGGTVEWFAEQNATDLDLGPNDCIAFIEQGGLVVHPNHDSAIGR